MEIQHFIHSHSLTFCMLSDQEAVDHEAPPRQCGLCDSYIHGPAYTCEDCDFWLDKSCSELPGEIEEHPFHSAHSLYPEYFSEKPFICDGCQEFCFGLAYLCKLCGFFLDMNCACLTYEEAKASKGAQAKATIQHFSHRHQLTWCTVREELSLDCCGCKEDISGAAYVCIPCQFRLHESCLQDMPLQAVEHPFHPQHHLLPQIMKDRPPQPMEDDTSHEITCNACYKKIRGINFCCSDCSFYLHVSCVKYNKTRAIKHQFHEHDLIYLGPKNIGRRGRCHYCGEDCNASFFSCIDCQIDIHLECLSLPLIVKHSRHFHPLILKDFVADDLGQYYCDICETERNSEDHVYCCEICNYTTHIDCVISQVEPPEKILSYLVPSSNKVEPNQEIIEEWSKIVGSKAEEESDTDISAEKLGIVKANDEDNHVGDYNDARKRNNLEEVASDPNLRDAKQSGKVEEESNTEDLESRDLEEEIKKLQEEVEELSAKLVVVQVKQKLVDPSSLSPSLKISKKIQHFSHDHTLIFHMIRNREYCICYGCGDAIFGPAYYCEYESCDFGLHKSCSELPREIEKHSLHPAHSLVLIQNADFEEKGYDFLICGGCQEVSREQKYICRWCRFSLDIKCAFLTDEEAVVLKGHSHVETTILHFSHEHYLTCCSMTNKFEESCQGCKDTILGPAYVCPPCGFLLHESCLNDMPREVNTPFHPEHDLLFQPNTFDFQISCNACDEEIQGINFFCDECSFFMHASCAKYQTRAIKHEFHQHDLFYFGPKHIGRGGECHSCGDVCIASFFSCILCDVNIHLECLPLPLIVKHSRHFHQLTLKDSVVEDDLGEYYCDICETERNPEYHVYYCEECKYIAHIDCVISQVEPPENIISYLIPRTKVPSISNLDTTESESEISDSESEAGIENLQEEEEGLIGSLELVNAMLKKQTEKLLDLMKKKSTN